MAVTAKDVKALRERTGAAMMDCKAALEEAGGDIDKASSSCASRARPRPPSARAQATSEGVVASYIHAGGKVGVLVEVQCETDFVARNDDFQEFAREVAIHIAGASPPRYVSADEIPEDEREAERARVRGEGARGGQARQRRREDRRGPARRSGRRTSSLLEQEHVRSDRYEGKTIEQLRAELAAKTGENVRIARFARFAVGQE